MKIHNIDQGTDEWLELRKGKFTASEFKNILGKDTLVGYKDAVYKNAYERLTGKSPEVFVSDWMKRGTELEGVARSFYEFENHIEVDEVGFVEMSEWIGCSPDGLIGDSGMLEIKCPKFTTHIGYLLAQKLPSTYKPQVQGQLWVCEREWCDFMSYSEDLKPFILRVERDEKYIKELEIKINIAIEKVKQIIEELK